MISLSKNQILACLENVSREFENMCYYSNLPIINFLSNLSLVDLRVYMFISKLRYLSYYEDAFIDLVNNNDIDFGDLRDRIFIDKSAKNKFSNKQIIKYIRNAFSHSDMKRELYKISVNGRYLEIHLKQTKPCEFHIKMSLSDLDDLIDRIETLNFYLSKFEDNRFKRFYLNEKIKEEDYLQIYHYLENKNLIDESELSRYILDYYIDTSKSYQIREYDVMLEQIEALNKCTRLIKECSDKIGNKDNKEGLLKMLNVFRNYELSKMIPLQEEKLSFKNDSMLFTKLICEYSNYTFIDIENEFQNTGYNLFNNRILSDIQNVIYSHIGNNIAHLFLFNGRDLVNDTYIEYISYYIMNICDDEVIKINNKEYSREKIRNSFAHGRWFVDYENNLVLCDAKNGKYNDYNFHWIERIRLIDLLDIIYQEQLLEQNVKIMKKN